MAIRKVARMGHPVLRQKAQKLSAKQIKEPFFQRLIQDMVDTMREYGGVGLAAPQVHEPYQIALIEVESGNSRYGNQSKVELHTFINPKVTVLDEEEQGFWEGCLSVPGLRGLVYRPRQVKVDYMDERGKEMSLTVEGFPATVIQHELDHLFGILYVDKITDMKNFCFNEEYQKYWLEA